MPSPCPSSLCDGQCTTYMKCVSGPMENPLPDEHRPSGKDAVKRCPFKPCSYVYRSWADENTTKC